MPTDLEVKNAQLVEVRAALSACAKNQSYSVLGRTFVKADLAELRKWESDLERQIARLSSGGRRRMQRVIPL